MRLMSEVEKTSEKRHFLASVRVTSLGTLASRVLGMFRDMATAALLGLSGSPVMDAFVIAFRIPNITRRLFGEGALTASYLPVFAERLHHDRQAAWQLASVVITWLAILLTGLVALAELGCAILWMLFGDAGDVALLLKLTALLLPYTILICLTAQVAATLHALSHFVVPTMVPAVLNICWLIAAIGIAPQFDNKPDRALLLAATILASGFLQLGIQLPMLRRLGFRFDYNWAASRESVRRIVRTMGPMMIGLAITQINTLLDSLIAWSLSSEKQGPIGWLGSVVDYPMEQGAAAAIYFGERLYQFPLGVLGLAVATVIFPLLSRHAAAGQRDKLGADLTLGLRLVLFLAVPAGVGMILLAEPIARLLFERGEFTAKDTARTARMIVFYGGGIWAYCALPVIVRGYYALGRASTPVRVGMLAVALNLGLNLSLVWRMGEAGLAISTSIAATAQVFLLVWLFARSAAPILWQPLLVSTARTTAATIAMTAATLGTIQIIADNEGPFAPLIDVVAPVVVAIVVYALVAKLLRADELSLIFGTRGKEGKQDDDKYRTQ